MRLLYDFIFDLKNDVNIPSKSNKQKNIEKSSLTKIAGSGSVSQLYGSANSDSDPYKNVTDLQHCLIHTILRREALLAEQRSIQRAIVLIKQKKSVSGNF